MRATKDESRKKNILCSLSRLFEALGREAVESVHFEKTEIQKQA
jgi:hypothetical protein